jgi:hypothetical protein
MNYLPGFLRIILLLTGMLLITASCKLTEIINNYTSTYNTKKIPQQPPIVNELSKYKPYMDTFFENEKKINSSFNDLKNKQFYNLTNDNQLEEFRKYFKFNISLPVKKQINELSRFTSSDSTLNSLNLNLLKEIKKQDALYKEFTDLLEPRMVKNNQKFRIETIRIGKEITSIKQEQTKIIKQISEIFARHGLELKY